MNAKDPHTLLDEAHADFARGLEKIDAAISDLPHYDVDSARWIRAEAAVVARRIRNLGLFHRHPSRHAS